MAKVLIIADDLTGAADCGVVFAAPGAEAMVLLGGPGEGMQDLKWPEGAAVVAVDVDTRCLRADEAADAVARIVHGYDGVGGAPGLLFKKVDSTLRGNVAAELAAALHARREGSRDSERVAMLFAPAFPSQGRTTVNGRLMVHGRPVDEADEARGKSILLRSGLDTMLGAAGLSCGCIGLAGVRGRAGALETTMLRIAKEMDVVLCDAENDEDLRAIAQGGTKLRPETVWAGSAGLARHLAQAIGLEGVVDSAVLPARDIQGHGPALFVVGSPASVSREQARRLAAESGVARFTVAAETMLSGDGWRELQTFAEKSMERLAGGEDVLVQFECAGGDAPGQSRFLVQSLGRAIRACAPLVGALVATGGETARAILDAWGIRQVRLVGEVESGVPYSVAECGNRSLRILTKAGGFGTPDTLLRCREFLRKPGSNPQQVGLGADRGQESLR